MTAPGFTIEPTQFATAFPFFLRFDRDLRLIDHGPSIAKLDVELAPGATWQQLVELNRPRLPRPTFDDLVALDASLCEVRLRGSDRPTLLSGQILHNDHEVCFIGSPRVTDLAELKEARLGLGDFAPHDATPTLLALLQTRTMALADAKRLADDLQARESDLRQAKRRAETANASKDRFLATMSHELRTPMNGVVGLTSILRESGLPEHQDHLVHSIAQSADALLGILDQLLEYSRLAQSRVPGTTEAEPVDIRASTQAVIDLLWPLARSRESVLDCSIEDSVPPTIRCAPDPLRRTLVNLVGNAIKFTHQGRVAVTVSCADDEHVQVSVTDSGIGIEPDKLERIFEPFVQADSSTTRKYGGTGLGLTICKHLVEQMGGTIQVTSEPGLGSEFRFTIPFQSDATEGESDHCDAVPAITTLADSRKRPATKPLHGHVLVADDHPVNQLVARRMLEQLGCTVSTAEDGEQAIRAVLDRPVDLVLMDYHMPVMDGLEATRILRTEHGCELPILAMTADATGSQRENCEQGGMDGFLAKPIKLAEMRSALAPWLEPARNR